MTIKTVACSIFVAGLLGLTAGTVSGQTAGTKEANAQTQLQPCEPHGTNPSDCHVHDKKTYLHLRDQYTQPGVHARNEINELNREEEQRIRGR